MKITPRSAPARLSLALLGLLIAGSLAPLSALAQTPVPTAVQQPPAPLDGRLLYAENCAPCHGVAGQGDGPSASGLSVPPAAFADDRVAFPATLAGWFDITKNGAMQRMMPPWKGRLDDRQIWNAVAFAWTLHTAQTELASGEAVYQANCAACHGATGMGGNGVPSLAGFSATSQQSQQAWAGALTNGRGAMPAFGDKLSAADRAAALEYARSLSFGGPMFRGPVAPGDGTITGLVTNKTTGQPVPAALVELGIFDETAALDQRSTLTDAQGRYRFEALPTDPGLVFAARTQYPAGVPYSTGFTAFESGNSVLELPVEVFETTTDATGITLDRVHYIVEFEPGAALIAEVVMLSNRADRAFLGEDGGGLRFTLPDGAQDLAIDGDQGQGRFAPIEGGFVDRLALAPGESSRQILYRYRLPYDGDALQIKRRLPYPAANINALVSDIGQQVESPQLRSEAKRQTGTGAYFNLVGENLPRGSEVSIGLARLAVAAGQGPGAASGAGSRVGVFVLAGLALLGAAALVALPLWRDRGAPGMAAAGSASLDQDALVELLARLALDHEAGLLTDAEYQLQRMRAKARLVDLLRQDVAA